ncbi:BCCT family transporter [Pseudogracilibacillus auburnensis]|uniref:BCCT family transporter n=1 Tax=Pseudogracilibacillus auburnensis TaxID=1494959 RepID=UPI001A96856E|nr:BCCT family transporter [Pseudogracilibacillus auburnensis]MBO1005326.1 BCCT family transporter [Pseudogracilibacillus auburnensis]
MRDRSISISGSKEKVKAKSKGKSKEKSDIPYNNSVFWISAIVIIIVVLFGAIWPATFAVGASSAFDFTTYAFGWLYLLAVLFFVLSLLTLAVTKYGKLKLGSDNSKPDYPFFTWVGMLMSCGLGIGLVFWGIAEPMSHFFSSPFGREPLTTQAARTAMGYAFFHWGLSQWAIFSMVGLAVGFFQFRKKEDGLISTTLKPIIKNGRSAGPIKKTIDTLAVIATVVGIATSLGLGIMQINGGMSSVFGLTNTIGTKLGIVAVMLICYLASSISGLDKGIKWLSNINLTLVFVLMLYVFITGPTVFILNSFTQGLGDYVTHFIEYSLRLSPYSGGRLWVREWTIFYWAWTIAWSPFVGAFIGRVSRGRTIREFILGVLIIPPLISLLWVAVFGGTAIYMDLFEGTNIAQAVNQDVTAALFFTFNELPLSFPISVLAIILIFTFLVTSADSASYILGSMTTNGMPTPPIIVRAIWGVLISAIAAVLTIASGLEGLQTASLVAALPFTIILIVMSVTMFNQIRKEYRLTVKG